MHHIVKDPKLGTVSFDIERFPSCCGISIIEKVSFYDVKDKKKLYFWFYNTVIWGNRNIDNLKSEPFSTPIERSHSYWRVNKIIMADRTFHNNNKEGSIYEFCMSQKDIIRGTLNDNPNSPYQTMSFELNRPKNKYGDYNGRYLEPVVCVKK